MMGSSKIDVWVKEAGDNFSHTQAYEKLTGNHRQDGGSTAKTDGKRRYAWKLSDKGDDWCMVDSKEAQKPVFVDIFSGKDLKSMDSNGLSDPYVIVKLNNVQVYKTRVVPKSLNPVWNERFELLLPPGHTSYQDLEVKFSIWDKDTFSDDPMGSACVKIPPTYSGWFVRGWFDVKDGKTQEPQGQLNVQIIEQS